MSDPRPPPISGWTAGIAPDADSETLPRQVPGVKLASAFNGSSSLVALTRLSDGCFVDVNDSFERALGYPREDLIGKTSVELGIWDAGKRERFVEELIEQRHITTRP